VTTNDNGEGGPPAAGWYPDAANPARERLWTGERWIEWIRPVKAGRVEADPAGWRPDASRPGIERLWSGEMWTGETRRVGEGGTATGALGATAAPGGGPVWSGPVPPTANLPAVLHHDDRPPQSLRALGILTQIALVAVILAAVAELIANGIYLGTLGDAIHHQALPISHTESVVDAVHATRTIYLIAEAITAIAFLFWFYRAYRNLIRTGIRDVRYGPGWAVGGWFIPFFNLVRPKQVANDIWKGSASAGSIGIARWREIPLAGLVNWWWGVWILGWLLAGLGSHAATQARADLFTYTTASLREQRTSIWLLEFGLAALIAAAVLAIILVRRISRLQDDNFTAVPAWNPATPAPGHPWATTASPGAATPPGAPAPPEDTKTCPDCAEQVKVAARVCRYCGYRFEPPPT
jgi:Domain of unknown function (DUF4328)/Uncharacterised protein family UPF0547/Protein of unknown function (DUF2510)